MGLFSKKKSRTPKTKQGKLSKARKLMAQALRLKKSAYKRKRR